MTTNTTWIVGWVGGWLVSFLAWLAYPNWNLGKIRTERVISECIQDDLLLWRLKWCRRQAFQETRLLICYRCRWLWKKCWLSSLKRQSRILLLILQMSWIQEWIFWTLNRFRSHRTREMRVAGYPELGLCILLWIPILEVVKTRMMLPQFCCCFVDWWVDTIVVD